MKRLRSFGLVIVSGLVLSALASASASAENVEVLPVPTKTAPLKFTGKGGAGQIEGEVAGSALECKEVTGKGEITSANLGVGTTVLTGCKSALSGAKCESLPKVAAGTIEFKGDIHLVAVLLPKGEPAPELMLGTVGSMEELLHIECGAALLVLAGGTVIGEATKVAASGVPTKEITGVLAESKGVQKIKECDLDKAFCSGKTFGLYLELGKGREKAGLASEGTTTLEKEAAFDY